MIKKLFVLLLAAVLFLTSCYGKTDTSQTMESENIDALGTVDYETEEIVTEESSMDIYPVPEPIINDAAKVWLDLRLDTNSVIMDFDSISAENDRVCNDSDVMTDICAVPEVITADDIKGYIAKGHVPYLPKYDTDGTAISYAHLNSVVSSMGQDDIPSEVTPRLGIVTTRANLRAFPDDKPYRKAPNDPYDTIQQTELHVATPLWIVHESTDGEYLLVRSSNYAGWVKSECVAIAESKEDWLLFASPADFVCVIDTSIKLLGTELDMGVILPFVGMDKNDFIVNFPVRDENGFLVSTEVNVSSASVSKGYLDFTYEHFISQAFKYEGVMYSWGGLDTGVDCSGFISNVLRTFGFRLPRDTKDQQKIVGTSVEVRGKTHAEIAQLLESTSSPTAVYYPGHVLFYLGYSLQDGKYYFIHAPQIGEAVSLTGKTSLAGMTYICEFTAKTEINNDGIA